MDSSGCCRIYSGNRVRASRVQAGNGKILAIGQRKEVFTQLVVRTERWKNGSKGYSSHNIEAFLF